MRAQVFRRGVVLFVFKLKTDSALTGFLLSTSNSYDFHECVILLRCSLDNKSCSFFFRAGGTKKP